MRDYRKIKPMPTQLAEHAPKTSSLVIGNDLVEAGRPRDQRAGVGPEQHGYPARRIMGPENRDHREGQHDIADSVCPHDEDVFVDLLIHFAPVLNVFNIREGRLSRKVYTEVLTPGTCGRFSLPDR
jgi:hypothetical protein